ncbi:MAG: PD-(D/E)XK nuclease family protein [Bacteroides sp.]|nr:PD-(D/E)XK nuclease family protein [Eubacterium sp.]MCM1419040.1 PD-(D/E)XK nuclease family protein [Roseburia sp.]MCM1463404.1 PD-(D/E)XK nuclease family protein [Bacteroides sp.]
MLEIIYGEAGTGKSELLYKKIREEAERGERVFLFVPDQFSFEAEKIVYKTVPAPAARNVSVTMFSRAAAKLLHRYGETKDYADDVVKTMLMTRALNALAARGALLYYRRQLKKPGFPAFSLGLIARLRGAGLTPSSLRSLVSERADRFSPLLLNKLNDLCEIYTEYDALLSASFDDRLDDVRRAAELIPVSEEYAGAHCFFDGFDDFSGSQSVFLCALLGRAASAVFTVTTDSPETDKPVFRAAAKLIARLKEMNGGEAILLPQTKKYRAGCRLEAVSARDPWEECDWICAKIRELTDEGFRCREIAVLTPKPVYAELLESAMKKYEIPFFADIPEPILHKSIVRFAIDALRAMSFETDDLLRYVKSGFVRHSDGKTISFLQADLLERICRRYDVRKRDWLRAFPKGIDGEGGAEEGSAEALRKSVIDPLRRLKRRFENADGAEMTVALCDFLCNEMDVNKTIYGLCITGREADGRLIVDKKKLDEYTSLWDDAVTVFESAYEALKGDRLTLAEYIATMTGIFSTVEIAKPPQTLDAVTVGDVERSRFRRVRAVFLCGFNRGVFPRPPAAFGAFSAGEEEELCESGIALASDRETRYSSELFLTYRAASLPEERLYVTFPAVSETLGELSPSPLLDRLFKRFGEGVLPDGANVRAASGYGAAFYCRTPASARRYLAGIYADERRSGEREAIRALLAETGETARFDPPSEPDRHRLSPENARRLLTLATYSPSAIQKMNGCKFDFFCTYGLGLRDEEDRSVNAVLYGRVVHFCLERLLTEYAGRKDALIALSDNALLRHARESVKKYGEENFFGDFGAAERFSYQLTRLSEPAARAAIRLREEMRLSGFTPLLPEKKVEFRFGDLTIKGICDRLDLAERDGKSYLRVIDYKHGKSKLKLADVYRGEELQMLLYLFGLCEEYGAEPSSVLYQPIDTDRFGGQNGFDREVAAQKQKQSNERNHLAGGIMLDTSPERAETDALNEAYTALYGKVKSGYADPVLLTREGFSRLKKYCKAYVNALALETSRGMASACPSGDACRFCGHGLFCGRAKET